MLTLHGVSPACVSLCAALESLEGHGCFPDIPTICRSVEVISKHVFVLSFHLESHCQGTLNYGSGRAGEDTRRWPGHHSSRNRAVSVHSAASPTRGSLAGLCTTGKHPLGPSALVCSKCLLISHLLRNITYFSIPAQHTLKTEGS